MDKIRSCVTAVTGLRAKPYTACVALLCLGLSACVEEPLPLNSELEAGDSAPNAIGGVELVTGGEAGTPTAGGGGRPPRPQPAGDEIPIAGAMSGEQAGAQAGAEPVIDPPPPPVELSPCERFCERTQDCLYPICEPLEDIPPRDFCQGWCDGDQGWLNQSAELSCEDFNGRIFGFSPEIRALCSPPDVDRCEEICDFGELCGLVSSDCSERCDTLELGGQLCFSGAVAQGDCSRFIECLQGGGGQGGQGGDGRPSLQEACQNICNREAQCVQDRCAPGTINGTFSSGCVEGCLATPNPRDLQARLQLSCDQLVEELSEVDAGFEERCGLDDQGACEELCASTVSPCGALEAEQCVAECAQWSEARFLCFSRATLCEEVNTCLLPEEEAARCGRLCGHLEGCLYEACPPRIIPTQLIESCSADCFNDPVSEQDLVGWEESSCAEVREFIYRDSPQLRPICEGNQDFRPSPSECAAFCEQSLDACLLGGSALCLSACSSLTRPQYECSLAAQGECDAIDLCLTEG